MSAPERSSASLKCAYDRPPAVHAGVASDDGEFHLAQLTAHELPVEGARGPGPWDTPADLPCPARARSRAGCRLSTDLTRSMTFARYPTPVVRSTDLTRSTTFARYPPPVVRSTELTRPRTSRRRQAGCRLPSGRTDRRQSERCDPRSRCRSCPHRTLLCTWTGRWPLTGASIRVTRACVTGSHPEKKKILICTCSPKSAPSNQRSGAPKVVIVV